MSETVPITRGTSSPPAETPRQGERSPNIPKIPGLAPRDSLLVWQQRDRLAEAVKNHSTIILAAGTGTGKTRGGSQIALEAMGPDSRMVVTENLRRATEKSAEAVAVDMQVEIGQEVGVRNRYTHDFSDKTKLLFCPVQSLLVMMEDDPMLERYNMIAMDEVHKESKANEMAMLRLRDIQAQRKQNGKPELKLMFISATADKDKITQHFPDAVTVDVPGKTYPVDEKYETHDIPVAEIPKKAAEKVRASIDSGDKGNILVFLSGKGEIEATAEALKGLPDVKIVPYFSAASQEEQDQLFAKTNERKIVLATNAAQEGLSLDINVVVDTGMHKHMELDVPSGRQSLVEQKAPRDHLIQRRGRVGRDKSPYEGQNDKYYALFTEADRNARPEHEAAEMQRTDLTSDLLVLMAQGNPDIRNFNFINKPSPSHIDVALARLTKIGALKDNRLTEKGKLMAQLQLKPNTASMVVSAVEHGAVKNASALGAMLEVYNDALNTKNGSASPFKNPNSDVQGFIQIFQTFHNIKDVGQQKKWARDNNLNYFKLHDAVKLYNELLRTLKDKRPGLNLEGEESAAALNKSIAEGFADSVIRLSRDNDYFLEGVGRVQVKKDSALYGKKPKQFITLNLSPVMKDGIVSVRYAELNHEIPDEALVSPTESKPADKAVATSVPPAPLPEKAPPEKPKDEQPKPEDITPPPPPKPPTLKDRIKNWFSNSIFGKFWKWFTR